MQGTSSSWGRHRRSPLKATLTVALGCQMGVDSPGPKYAPSYAMVLPPPSGQGGALSRAERFHERPRIEPSIHVYSPDADADDCHCHAHEEARSPGRNNNSNSDPLSHLQRKNTTTTTKKRVPSSPMPNTNPSIVSAAAARDAASMTAAAERLSAIARRRMAVRDDVRRKVIRTADDLAAFHTASAPRHRHVTANPFLDASGSSVERAIKHGPRLLPMAPSQTPGPGCYDYVALPPSYLSTKRFCYFNVTPRKAPESCAGDGSGKYYVGTEMPTILERHVPTPILRADLLPKKKHGA